MKPSRAKGSRKITAAEVRRWVGNSKRSKLGPAQCNEIAEALTSYRWPADPPSPPGSPWVPREIDGDPDRWWDFKATTEAAKALLKSAPAMLSHWEGQRWTSQTRDGFDVIKALGDALFLAMPYIEWPFGYYERQARRRQPKPWHTMAVIIANLVIKVLIESGQNAPGITRNSVVVRVIRNALVRMDFPNSKMITPSAIGMHLERWDKKYGLTPNRVAALTTKQLAAICDRELPNVASYPLGSDVVAWRRKWLRQIATAQKNTIRRKKH
jgi:hypothetical protein